ncbi:uncharacterized protein LOC133199448 [Saccostrea echinata]|uniref:uncharacterized protein LOC133199448 n=1 Tax=Saccostrea echinata TaxID=191078 RepID=UPI002A81CB61|nr:uncharacterized protein LOC133199448 [Saccostrea echinata]
MSEGGKQILLLILIVAQGESFLESSEPLTWIAAQKFCSDQQKILIPGTKEDFPSPHWTGYYHRLSDWIHVLGCHGVQSVEDLVVLSNYTLDRGSVGLCQERCGSNSFALQNTTCLCLRETPQINSLLPSRCDYYCPSDDDSHVNDCGGGDTYNVYRVTPNNNLTSERTVNCVVLGCYEQYSQIHTNNCTEDLGRVCESEASTNKTIAPDEENFKSWNHTYTECREGGSYLYGNLSLNEDSRALCNKLYNIKSNTPETWLGVARQVFRTTDRGEQLDGRVVIDCSICQGQAGCSYVDNCNSNTMKATAICGNEDDLLPPTLGTGETSTMTSTSGAITAAPAPKTGIGDDAKQAIAITVSLVVVGIVLVIIGVVCIRKRRQRSGKPDEVPGEKFGKNVVIESERGKGSVDSFMKENINSKTIGFESPTPSVSIPKDTQRESNNRNDKKELKESEVVTGDSSNGKSDEAKLGSTNDLIQQSTTPIDTENKLGNNTKQIDTENKLDNDTRQIDTENKLDNCPNTEEGILKDSPEDKSEIIKRKVENTPYCTEIIPENDAKNLRDSKEIPTTDIDTTRTKEAEKTASENTNTKQTEMNVPYVDRSKTIPSKDDGVRLPVTKATANSMPLPIANISSGNPVNKKNVSIIQVSKF